MDAGGLLMVGLDPTGSGALLQGFGDQHEVELLVTDGAFSLLLAIRIANLNGWANRIVPVRSRPERCRLDGCEG